MLLKIHSVSCWLLLNFCLIQVYPCYVVMLLIPDTECKVTLAKREILIAKSCHIETRAEYFQIFVRAMEVHVALSFNIMHLCLPLCQLPFCQWWEGRSAAGSWHHASECFPHPLAFNQAHSTAPPERLCLAVTHFSITECWISKWDIDAGKYQF